MTWTIVPCDCEYDGFTSLDPDVLCVRCRGYEEHPAKADWLDVLAAQVFRTKTVAWTEIEARA